MKFNNDETWWAPEGHMEYLCALKRTQNPPKTAELLLLEQVKLLKRLVAEANEGEIQDANRRLELNLQQEELVNLPGDLLDDPKTPNVLLVMPAALNYPLADWKAGMEDAIKLPPMPEIEAREEAENLSLESFIGRIV